jgi:hypothetical protein
MSGQRLPSRLLFSLAYVFGEEVSENGHNEDSMMQASGEPRHNVGNLRAIWLRLPLFWRFQLAGWAVFIPLTFPLKVLLAGTIPRALLLSFIRDGSSFALTLGMWVIYRRGLKRAESLSRNSPDRDRRLPNGRTPANRIRSSL